MDKYQPQDNEFVEIELETSHDNAHKKYDKMIELNDDIIININNSCSYDNEISKIDDIQHNTKKKINRLSKIARIIIIIISILILIGVIIMIIGFVI